MAATRRAKLRTNRFILLYLTIFSAFIQGAHANEEPGSGSERKRSLAIYGGPGSPTPLVEISRFQRIELEPKYIITLAFNQPIVEWPSSLVLESEAQVTHHMEQFGKLSFNAAIALRWLRTPWQKAMRGSFAFGNGLSYATDIPTLESEHLPRNSNLLYYLLFEFAAPITDDGRWEGLFRVHHRSGVFGLFNDVVGGSDFFCLGLRYQL